MQGFQNKNIIKIKEMYNTIKLDRFARRMGVKIVESGNCTNEHCNCEYHDPVLDVCFPSQEVMNLFEIQTNRNFDSKGRYYCYADCVVRINNSFYYSNSEDFIKHQIRMNRIGKKRRDLMQNRKYKKIKEEDKGKKRKRRSRKKVEQSI